METKFIVILIVFILFAILGIIFLRPTKVKESPDLDYDLVMGVLQLSVQRELTAQKQAYDLKRMRFPTDYTEDVVDVVQRITRGISPYMFKQMEFYHTREYIITKISKDVQAFMIEFIRVNGPKSNKNYGNE